MTNLFVKKLVSAALCAASFFILHSLFFSTPTRAQLDCGAYGFEENGCCNYGDATRNLYHITADDARCNSNHCERRSFSDDTFPYTDCNYCHRDGLCMRKDNAGGCAGVCNNNCCPPPDGDEDEGDCHMEDENLTTCCPVEDTGGLLGALHSTIETIKNLIPDDWLQHIIPTVSLTIGDFKASKDFEKATDYYYGAKQSSFEEGVFFRLAPPNLLEEQVPSPVETREEWAKWIIGTSNISGRPGDDAISDGKLKHVEPYRLAVENLRNFLVAIPKTENTNTSKNSPKTALAASSSTTLNPKDLGQVLGTSAEESCNLPLIEAETKNTCTPSDAEGGAVGLGDLLNLSANLFPKIADLDKIGRYTAGVETDEGGAARPPYDPHYEDGGFLEIFKLPTEEEYLDINAKGEADGLELHISIPNPSPLSPPFRFTIPIIGSKILKLRHQGSDTEAREKENGVWDKLTPPQAEDSTMSFEGTGEPTIYLASNPTVLAGYQTQMPQTTSFAERVGRTLGSWLGRLITL